jgi:glycosyltransferase involved in cell wall biosynthesis
MNERNKISVVINTYNAEQHLKKCLEAVKDFDEVVVCDMESTDHTVEIAQSFGCKVVTFPKANHKSAEPARTFAIQSAIHDWVLVVDADEIVTPELRNYLYARIREKDCPTGIYIPRLNRFMLRYTKSNSYDYQLRFFRKEGITWPPYVHTFPSVNGRTEKIPHKMKKARFVHLADETISVLMQKTNAYTDSELEKRATKFYGLSALMGRPLWRFFRNYILKMGFLDGMPGLIRAGMDAVYQFVLVAKNMEQQYRNKKQS